MSNTQTFDIDNACRQALALLQQMVAIPSVSREEQAVADFLQHHIHAVSGLEVHRHHHNLWLVDPHYDVARPTLLLNAHIDTVRPAATWQHHPYTPSYETVQLSDGTLQQRLYGLGTNDDGASVVSLLQVFLLMCDVPRAYNLVYLVSAEEEVSGRDGIESVLPLLPRIDVALVGEPTGMQPAIAEKGLLVLDGVALGRSGHAARNEGVNALYLAIDAAQRLRDYHFERQSPTLGPIKVTVTGMQCGTSHNVIPDVCAFMVDCRTTDAYSNEEVVLQLQQAAGATPLPAGINLPRFGTEVPSLPPANDQGCIYLAPRSTRLQPSGIDLNHPLVQRIVSLGRQPFGSPTLSDQALMRFPSIKMGPGQSSRSHTADEYICPSEVREAIQLYLLILDGLIL